MKAIVLCAGYGKRLKPYTDIYQKSMIPIHGKPLLEYIINGLIFAGLKKVILVVGYLKEQVIDYFQEGTKWGIELEYVEQDVINGTGGAVLLCEDLIKDDHFFLTWGDILVPYKIYKEILEIHKRENKDFLLVANYSKDPFRGGAIQSINDHLTAIIEKPKQGESKSNLNNCGILILAKEIFNILKILKPTERGEIELTEAIQYGIKEQNWKFRVIKMARDQFRGDFGDKDVYEHLKIDSSWLKELTS
ncbi:MAG: nucleotidyltransferase family protein [Promethearchaeota archaeon]